ncbi:MAG: AI-2E family transporter [Roseburia sp.]|nr:AI-2E family transporter [Roseburia sp.]
MEENGKSNGKRQKPDWDLQKYIVIALITFVTFCCCILFFFVLYRYHGFREGWQKLMKVLQPIIIGFIVAYLMNPVMMFLERNIMSLLEDRVKSKRQAKKISRTTGTIGAILFLLLIIFLLLNMMIPELISSIQNMMESLPQEIDSMSKWVEKIFNGDDELAYTLNTIFEQLNNNVEHMVQQLIPELNTYVTSITTGVVNVVKVLVNFLIGLVVAIYLLMSKETFIGQGKKIVYAVFPTKIGNYITKTLRVSNDIFGGFISGKILDSAIIGVLCYIGLLILKMPYSMLVAVIVGVTNIIPFFGPYIGAVPSFILIALAEPIKGVYFLIFVLVLQQLDGNFIGPKILGNSTGLSPFWVVFAILVGGGLFGFMGMLLGVPTFAVIYYLIREVVAYVLRKRKLPEATVDYIEMENIDIKTKELRYGSSKKS